MEGWGSPAFGDVFCASTAVESASNVMEQGEGRELRRCLKGGSNVWEIWPRWPHSRAWFWIV